MDFLGRQSAWNSGFQRKRLQENKAAKAMKLLNAIEK